MTATLSPNTQAILLLTAPLIAGRGTSSSELLSLGEYKRLARHLRAIQRQPADLVSPDAADLLRACQPVIDEARLQRLLGRGFLLSQVIERWQARAIWVVSRADAEYPRRLKARLREDAPLQTLWDLSSTIQELEFPVVYVPYGWDGAKSALD